MENNNEEKIYFSPGNIVTLKQDIPNKPLMIVHRIQRSFMRNKEGKDLLKGCNVRWFTETGFLQEAIFSTKDLILVE